MFHSDGNMMTIKNLMYYINHQQDLRLVSSRFWSPDRGRNSADTDTGHLNLAMHASFVNCMPQAIDRDNGMHTFVYLIISSTVAKTDFTFRTVSLSFTLSLIAPFTDQQACTFSCWANARIFRKFGRVRSL